MAHSAYQVPDSEGLQSVPSGDSQHLDQKQVAYGTSPQLHDGIDPSNSRAGQAGEHGMIPVNDDDKVMIYEKVGDGGERSGKPRIWGVSRGLFWGLMVVVLGLVALGVGLGVGLTRSSGSLVSQSRATGQTTSTTTIARISTGTSAAPSSSSTATRSPTTVPTTGILAIDCPAQNNTQYTSQPNATSYIFTRYCDKDLYDGGIADIQSNLTSTMDACIDLCATWNDVHAGSTKTCNGMTWSANLTRYHGANCFLKTGVSSTMDYVGAGPGTQASAILNA